MKQVQPVNRWLALLAVTLAFLPIVLDMTILHVAIPSLTLALHASGTQVLWIIDIYPLLMASLLIPMGTLADRVGHRRLLLLGLFFFLMGSVFAAFSPSVGTLISARAVMAVGGAMIIPCTLAIIRLTFSDERERAIALGTWGAVASAGAAVGPLVGGLLLEHFWWGSVFLINAPVMLLVFPLVFAYTPRSVLRGDANWTIGQALVLMVGLMVSVYAIKSGFKPDSTVSRTLGMMVVGLSLLAWFVHRQLHAANPMLDMSLFSKPAISGGVVMALVVMGSLAGVELMLAQELQFVLGMTPLQAGLFMLPLMVGSGVGGPFAGWILGLVGLRAVATLSLLAAAASLVGLAMSSFADAGIGVVLLLALLGMALGIGLTASSVAIMSSTPPEKAGSAGALEATSYDLGTGLGITGFGLVLTSSYQKSIHLPADIAPEIAASATHSIGETMLAAHDLVGPQGQALIDAGKRAFSTSHSMVLLSAAMLIGILSVVIFYILRHHRAQTVTT